MDGSEISRVSAQIDLDAVFYNMESMHRNMRKDAKMIAVIKADGYGHGALPIAEAIEELPYLWGYAVATADEAFALLNSGRKKPVLILGISFPEQYEAIVSAGVRPAVCDWKTAELLSKEAQRQKKTCRIHIKIDTGMSRIGFQADASEAETILKIARLPNIEVEGIFTHFARADEISLEPAEKQLKRFREMTELLERGGLSIPLKHCSNSAGILRMPEANLNLVRAGITLYGLWPSEDVPRDILPLKPVMSIRSHISFLKELEAGREVSYGGTYVTTKKTMIATVPVGYADGYARGLSNRGYVLIRGQKAPICGRVCMDQFMVDVTGIKGAAAGDPVTLLGTDGDHTITMEELGALSGRFNYEFACLITPRVPRIYIKK